MDIVKAMWLRRERRRRAIRTITGVPPLTFKGKGKNLKNYRIYGNTVNGESVGDLIAEGEHAGEYRVPVTVANGTDTQTTNIYLPEQIKMVGNEAEYIDYEEQKQHRVRKNLFQNTATSRTYAAGITLTVNNDKSVVVDGTSNTEAPIGIILGGNIIIGKGTYTLSGCPQGGSNNTYKVICIFNDNGERKVITDSGNGATVVLNNDDAKIISNGFYISAQKCDNKIFYPMLRKANIEDNTYEPYIEDIELNVTLPALPTLSGTNILSIGTTVQPSEVYIKGKIKEKDPIVPAMDLSAVGTSLRTGGDPDVIAGNYADEYEGDSGV